MKNTDTRVQCRVNEILIFCAHLPRDNLLVDLNGLVGKERRVTSSHLVDQHSESPPVHCLIITLRDRESRRRQGYAGID